MSNKRRIQVAALAIVTSTAYMVLQGAHNFTNYFVTVRTYQANPARFGHRIVRLQGRIVASTVRYNGQTHTLQFLLRSGTATIPVDYRGVMPDEELHNAGAIAKGRVAASGVFFAQKLEIQCPDHYSPDPVRAS